MNALHPFQAATPAMIVGRSLSTAECPLGLGEPFALHGGNLLGFDGIPLGVMHEHQPIFREWVAKTCSDLLVAERPWFRGAPVILTGPQGCGRTHAARWLARVVGVPHAILNLSDPVIATNVAASRQVGEALWASPVTIAMAASRCANPVVTVLGVDKLGADIVGALVSMIDPATSSAWIEDQLGVAIDLGEVTWIIQSDRPDAVSPEIRRLASTISLQSPPQRRDSVFALSVVLEAMADEGVDPRDPAFGWVEIRRHLPHHFVSAKDFYAAARMALQNLKHPSDDPISPNADEPFLSRLP